MKPANIFWTKTFHDLYNKKSKAHKKAIDRALRMMAGNLYHPSLRTRQMEGHGDIKEAHATKQQVMSLTLDATDVHMRVCCSHDQVYRNP